MYELTAQAEAVIAPGATGQRFGVLEAELAGVASVLELLGKSSHCCSKAQVIACFANRGINDRAFDQATFPTFRQLITHPQHRQFAMLFSNSGARLSVAQRFQPALLTLGDNFVQRSHGMSCTDFTGIDLVIAEVLTFQRTVFITQQAILADLRGVELHLQLDVFRHDGKG
ncbi:hypothetical protein D3C80_1267250 [compost metagenome]